MCARTARVAVPPAPCASQQRRRAPDQGPGLVGAAGASPPAGDTGPDPLNQWGGAGRFEAFPPKAFAKGSASVAREKGCPSGCNPGEEIDIRGMRLADLAARRAQWPQSQQPQRDESLAEEAASRAKIRASSHRPPI